MADLFTILDKIRQAPGLYIGRPSVSDLFMFLVGYDCARSEMGQELSDSEEYFYDNFQPWLQEKFGVRSVTSWAKLIMLSCHDEQTGFEQFFRLLDEFMTQAGQRAA